LASGQLRGPTGCRRGVYQFTDHSGTSVCY